MKLDRGFKVLMIAFIITIILGCNLANAYTIKKPAKKLLGVGLIVGGFSAEDDLLRHALGTEGTIQLLESEKINNSEIKGASIMSCKEFFDKSFSTADIAINWQYALGRIAVKKIYRKVRK